MCHVSKAHFQNSMHTKRKQTKYEIQSTVIHKVRKQQKMQRRVEKNGEAKNRYEKGEEDQPPLMALNHVSRLCRNVEESLNFYTKILGFVLIERPLALDFNGAWLFNYGVGIHLVQSEDEERLPPDDKDLDPMDNHISFQVCLVKSCFCLNPLFVSLILCIAV